MGKLGEFFKIVGQRRITTTTKSFKGPRYTTLLATKNEIALNRATTCRALTHPHPSFPLTVQAFPLNLQNAFRQPSRAITVARPPFVASDVST